MEAGALVVNLNGEWGWLERVTSPGVAWVRNADGFVQTFSLGLLRHPDPDADWEIFALIEERNMETQSRMAAE